MSLVKTWMGDRDQSRTIAHAWFLCENTDEWPGDFCKVEIVTLTLPSRVTEGWIFHVSGLAIMSVSMTRRRMKGHQFLCSALPKVRIGTFVNRFRFLVKIWTYIIYLSICVLKHATHWNKSVVWVGDYTKGSLHVHRSAVCRTECRFHDINLPSHNAFLLDFQFSLGVSSLYHINSDIMTRTRVDTDPFVLSLALGQLRRIHCRNTLSNCGY